MSQMANITIKKSDGTTDAIYSALSASAGEGVPAIWRNNGVGTKVNQRPEFRMISKQLQAGRRAVKTNFVWPVVDPITGSVVDYITLVVESKTADNALVTDVTEAVTQGLNLHAATLVKTSFVDGVSPT